ncbi:unnamed protein product [Ectocarpus sp. CCAP 1310/34]|nr:unnamed protein product [Ectocarpus sp. CCAP 1310/34]
MRRLLDKGVPIDAETENGDTPLSLAISAGGVGSVGFLVKAGAALDLADKVIIRFLQNNGATFKLIDSDVIAESHATAAALGVKTDADGKFSAEVKPPAVAAAGAVEPPGAGETPPVPPPRES